MKKQKKLSKSVVVLLLTLILGILLIFTFIRKINFGLDLKGGFEVLYLVEGLQGEKLTDEDKKLLEYTKEKKRIIVINKIDLENNLDISNLKNERIVKVSALKDSGIENLKNEINDMFNLEEINLGDFTYLSNSRQISLVKKAVEISKNLEDALNNDVPIDLLEIDIKEICEILGEIIGESYDDKLIDTLFSNFCLGK